MMKNLHSVISAVAFDCLIFYPATSPCLPGVQRHFWSKSRLFDFRSVLELSAVLGSSARVCLPVAAFEDSSSLLLQSGIQSDPRIHHPMCVVSHRNTSLADIQPRALSTLVQDSDVNLVRFLLHFFMEQVKQEFDELALVASHSSYVPPLNSLDCQLFEATDACDLVLIQKLVSLGASLNARELRAGASPLHRAASRGHVEVVNCLLLLGANVNSRALNFSTPLHWASSQGHVDVVQALLNAGADVSVKSSTWTSTVTGSASGQTALHWAVESGNSNVVEAILEFRPDAAGQVDEKGRTAKEVATPQAESLCAARIVESALASLWVEFDVTHGQRGVHVSNLKE